MPETPITYKNPPIVEALIDFKVEPSATLNAAAAFEKIAERFISEFPSKKNLNQFKINLPGSDVTQPIAQDDQTIGIRLDSENNKKVLQARVDGFTLSYVNTYTTWEAFYKDFQEFWGEYKKIFSPEIISRVAVRYINKLELSVSSLRPSEYFNLYPEVPNDMLQDIHEFSLRMVMPQTDIKCTAIITQATLQASSPNLLRWG